jgi:hypothetical protein
MLEAGLLFPLQVADMPLLVTITNDSNFPSPLLLDSKLRSSIPDTNATQSPKQISPVKIIYEKHLII